MFTTSVNLLKNSEKILRTFPFINVTGFIQQTVDTEFPMDSKQAHIILIKNLLETAIDAFCSKTNPAMQFKSHF